MNKDQIPSVLVEAVTLPMVLPNTDFPGHYNLQVCFEPRNLSKLPITKQTPWVYEENNNKLFVKMGCACPILFKIRGNPPPGSTLRGIMTYREAESYKDVVVRCANHRDTCKDGHPYQEHVMRCENPATRYEVCPTTGRLSIVIPLRATNVVVGESYFKELFIFMCYNSCLGGMNRRPTNLLFRLECGGKEYSRAIVEVRICASPGRDFNERKSGTRAKNAKDKEKRTSNDPTSTIADVVTTMPLSPAAFSISPTSSTTCYPHPATSTRKEDFCVIQEPFQFSNVPVMQKKRLPTATNGGVLSRVKRTCFTDPRDDELFVFMVRGRERYQILSRINEGLDLLDGIRSTESNKPRSAQNEHSQSSPESTKIKPKPQGLVQVEGEEGRSNQVTVDDDWYDPWETKKVYEIFTNESSAEQRTTAMASLTTTVTTKYKINAIYYSRDGGSDNVKVKSTEGLLQY